MADNTIVINADQFSAAMGSILEDLGTGVAECLEPAVKKAGREGRKACKKRASELDISDAPGRTTWARYVNGFSFTMKRKGNRVVGEIGQKNVPGLVHLIEKGHAKVGGGKTRAFPHIAPAAEDTFKVLEKEIYEAVGNSI